MTACRQTDAIERRLARNQQLTSAQAEHAQGCPACGATVAAAARLDAGLPAVVRRMVIEPAPPAAELLAVDERRGASRFVSRLGAVGAAAAAGAVIVVALVAGPFIGLLGLGPGAGSSPSASSSLPQVGAVPEDMAAWVAEADASIWEHMDRRLPAPDLRLVRLERCGDSALAFFADPEASGDGPLLFGIGNYREPPFDAGSGGVASSLDDPEAAYARSQMDPCEVVVDTALSHEDALAALQRLRVPGAQVLATKLVTGGIALVYANELDRGSLNQEVMVVRRDGGVWTVTGSQGGDLPVVASAVGVTPLGVAKGMPDDRWAAVGRTDDARVVAVEIDFEGFAHRYPVSGGAFVIQLPPDVGFELAYRLLDGGGNVVSAGVGEPAAQSTPAPSPSGATEWREPAAYSFTLDSRCGERNFIGLFRIEVEDGQVVGVVGLDDQGRRSAAVTPHEAVPTLAGLIDLVAQARRDGADEASLTTDPTDGHPVSVEIDWRVDTIDEEECYTVSDFAAG